MALELNFWESDGPNGETCHHTVRLKKKDDIEICINMFLKERSKSDSIVRVTLDRSDRQSPISYNIWVKPGYKDPFAV